MQQQQIFWLAFSSKVCLRVTSGISENLFWKKNENENYLPVISNNDEKYSTFKNDEKDWIKLDNEEKEWIKLNVGGIKVPIPISFLRFYYILYFKSV